VDIAIVYVSKMYKYVLCFQVQLNLRMRDAYFKKKTYGQGKTYLKKHIKIQTYIP